ncbi:neurogenic locus notch homolog protein 1-like isoform X3 [Stylophora pistillata]|uniref:neurogenic locus notch homolog protein 1-like isoform X3 n=1 Tax=Stylophora pistillata TaxID=50429 RepID=UPI000C0554B4|nr:neurogenic locus notch homolog protein 1-like isoform X3 [Stylophora pistillata]
MDFRIIKWVITLLVSSTTYKQTNGHDYCHSYHVINDRTRAASLPRGNVLRCDQRDIPTSRWYRFTGAAGTQMPTKCVPTNRCGTHAPGWLSTAHPTRTGQIINGKACFHWSGNCCRWSSNIMIKRCNGFYIYKLGKTPCCYLRFCGNGGFGDDGCTDYLQLNDRTRAASVPRGNILKCDKYDMPGEAKWYRFTGASGSMMATSCVPKHYCGTHAPGWLSGAHPTSVGQTVNAKVCFHWGGSCCNWNTNIQIKKCHGFYVYKLHKTPVCWLRYCGNAGFDVCKVSNPCKNSATCVPKNGGYTCNCKPGYHGVNCEHDVNECNTRPCRNGGTCENLPGSYRCKCKPGFLGKHCEIAHDECKHYQVLSDRERAAGVHRGNTLKCDQRDLVTPKWYRFTGAAGTQMPTSCVPKHYCGTHAPGWLTGSHPTRVGEVVNRKVCFHWGSNCCSWSASVQIKRCNGFYVYKLVRTPVCWLRYCGNAGFNPCRTSRPCQNGGTCVNQNGGYKCNCKPGYQGINCQQDVNECLTRPCRNSGTCENLSGSYRCKCKPGYLGKHCEIVFDECKHYEVLNDKERAAGRHRGNFLKCDQRDLVTPKWYRFTGAAGSQMPTACVSKHYCGTHAPGWLSGSHPTRVGQVVNGKVCFHWGSNCCNWNAAIQIKKCNGFYVYKLARTPVCWLRYCGNAGFDPCRTSRPCQNGATCVNQNSGYKCLCKPGYQGMNCEQDVNECLRRPCRNGGTCENLSGSYRCKCKTGYLGKHCEIVFDECKHYEVLNDKERAAGRHRGNFLKCDQRDLVAPKWYRFTGAAGSQMPTACVPKHYCGTHAPGWLSGSHPTRVGQVVNGKVCFHWGSNCCNWNAAIQIKKCNGFYVYKLTRTPVCWLRYCGNAGFDPCKASKPCQNGATCVNKNYGYTCLCKPGYQGENCEQDIDECRTRPCRNGGACENVPGSYRCKCKPGFLGKQCEIAFDECKHYEVLNDKERAAGRHRGNFLKCDQRDLVTPKWYRFTGEAGSQMPTACVPKHYCGTHAPGWLSGSHPTRVGQVVNGKVCFHWGSNCCNWNAAIQIKKCNGFYVYKLTRTPVCWLRYCGNSGFDPCKASKPCQNGATCVNQNGGYTCLCKPGYQGKNCEQDVNECVSKPCRNGGTCENIPGSYRCKCKPGFLGKHCEIVFDECKHYEVLNDRERAAGVHRGNIVKCDQRDLVTPKWYRFTGAAGSQMPTACVPKHYCGTHAPGWLSGSHPTRVGQVVNGKVCFHWGSNCCNWNAAIQIKKCNGFYVYKLTRTPVCWLRYCGNAGFDPCKASKPCQNGATCVNQNGGYTCLCKPGYQGKNCEQDVNECVSKPCRNGGTCENLQGSYRCKCKSGFLGKHCEIVFDNCKHYEVLNDRERAAGVPRGNILKCDQRDLVTPKWYRFTGAAGTQMPTACVPKHYCGTHAPGWLSTAHPSVVGQVVNGKVCFHWGSRCCNWYANIQIKKCNGFYVYRLTRTPVCWLRFCGNSGFDPCKASRPCQNGATCVNNQDGYKCLCKPGYQGKNCEQDVNECSTRPCLNGGTCQNLPGSYKCNCKPGFLGSHCETAFDACLHYETLSDRERAASVHRGNTLKCDQRDLVTPKWYRITGAAGTMMPTSCVPKHYCGTHAPGWLSTAHPSVVGQVVNGKVCFHWGSRCCNWHANIQIKKCNGFFVYKLARTPVCYLRYCGNAEYGECKINKPCKNGATCIQRPDGYSCVCRSGFHGKHCENDINECLTTKPCKNGATCINSNGGYRCLCVPGFQGKNCETDVNECLINGICKNGGTCNNIRGGYRCQCLSGYQGKHCEQDINECLTTKPCKNGATCVNSNGGYRCLCVPGFQGKHCETDVNECLISGICKNGGSCINTHGGYRCQCLSGYQGKHCELDVNECITTRPCKNGATCVNKNGGYDCLCVPGFKGKNCERDVNECITRPCLNGGTCVNQRGSYQCVCLAGFTGKHCETQIDPCSSYVILDEKDRAAGNDAQVYKCDQRDIVTPAWYRFSGDAGDKMADSCVPQLHCGTHAPGWLNGDHPINDGEVIERQVCFHWGSSCCKWSTKIKIKKCKGFFVYELQRTPACRLRYCGNSNLPVNECVVTKPCKNGATCVDMKRGYQCLCAPGFTGKDCEQDVDECLISGLCKNGATCQNSAGGYQCKCPSGFKGKHCDQDIDECATNDPCRNGATCINIIGGFQCSCASGFEGKYCEQDEDECKVNPCKNSATCINLIGGFECQCVPGFQGKVCEQDIDECQGDPCLNSGNCSNTPGSYKCECIRGFEGKNCENDVDECKESNPCQNGGTCQNKKGTYHCSCPDGITGFNCEIKISFKELGCYRDRANDRTMTLLKNLRKYIDWRDMSKTVKNCSEIARGTPGVYYFAIQYYGECFGAPPGTKYDKFGEASNCWSGVGGANSNYVYTLY